MTYRSVYLGLGVLLCLLSSFVLAGAGLSFRIYAMMLFWSSLMLSLFGMGLGVWDMYRHGWRVAGFIGLGISASAIPMACLYVYLSLVSQLGPEPLGPPPAPPGYDMRTNL